MSESSENYNKNFPQRDYSGRSDDPGTGPTDQRFGGKNPDEATQSRQAQPITSGPGHWNAGERNAAEEGRPVRAQGAGDQQARQQQSNEPSTPEGVYGQSGSFGQVWRDTEGGIGNRDLEQEQALYGNPDADGKQSNQQSDKQSSGSVNQRGASDTPNPT